MYERYFQVFEILTYENEKFFYLSNKYLSRYLLISGKANKSDQNVRTEFFFSIRNFVDNVT